jgi:hypothetical protein
MIQTPICVDDFGNLVYSCCFTGVKVTPDQAISIGATLPGVKAQYFMANTDEAREARKKSAILFHESERNCNTCSSLERVKHEKTPSGFLYGRCPTVDSSHPYSARQRGDIILFHPDDPMHMPCYTSRWLK